MSASPNSIGVHLKRIGVVALFALSLAYFYVRGPYRALETLDSYDYATVYGAARSWTQGENPYDMRAVVRQLGAAGRHDNATAPPSLYLPATMPLVAPIVWMRWPVAKVLWCLFSMAIFGVSLVFVIRDSPPRPLVWRYDWDSILLLAGCALFFSPVTSGLSTGNPSVITCSLCLLALHLVLVQRFWTAGLVLGIANCLKPQDSAFVIAVLVVWCCWRTLAVSFVPPAIAFLIAAWRAGSMQTFVLWMHTCQAAVASTFQTGGLSDPRPGNVFSYHIITLPSLLGLFIPDLDTENLISWIVAGAIAAVYLLTRKRTPASERPWRDLAFFSVLTLTIVYHRYYDVQILLASIPFVVRYFRSHRAAPVIYSICLVLLWFPLQPVFAEKFPGANPESLRGFLMLRHEPVLILVMALALIPWRNRKSEADGRERPERRRAVALAG